MRPKGRSAIAALILLSSVGVSAQKATEVPFRLVDGWAIVVNGTLGGLPGQNLLIDTGTVPSAIHRRVARKLGLSGLPAELSLINRSIAVDMVDLTIWPSAVNVEPC